ncbi:AAA domain-containing protein [Chryseobacterium indoltheticum]|uniref:AAA domain-containing protein n=1 Tax=Chryseobacterium indoltheticum TaxID=254 RepID=UPI003F498813
MLELLYIPNVDLLERLKNAFKELALWDNYKSTFPGIQYIYGPPGTGKTTEIQKLISTEINNNANVKILVLTPTNKACDVIAKRIFDNDITTFIEYRDLLLMNFLNIIIKTT